MSRNDQLFVLPATASEESKILSSVARVFGTYELVEMILGHLPFETLLKAQRICKMTHDVTADSKRLRGGHCVFTSEYHNLRPFKSALDFDTAYSLQPTDKPARYVDKGAGLVGGGSILDLQYGIELGAHISTSFGAGLARLHKVREKKCRRVTIKPCLETPTSTGNEASARTQELWRDVQWSQGVKSVRVTMYSKCSERHEVMRTEMFPSDTTLGQTFDWLHQLQGVPLACPCPSMPPYGLHRIHD